MKFRKRLFYGLAALVALYVVATVALSGDSAAQSRSTCAQQYSTQSSIDLCESAADVGTGLGVTLVLCVGGFFFAVFMMLGWRNGVGIRNELRHQEMLNAAQRGQMQ